MKKHGGPEGVLQQASLVFQAWFWLFKASFMALTFKEHRICGFLEFWGIREGAPSRTWWVGFDMIMEDRSLGLLNFKLMGNEQHSCRII